MSNTTWAIDGMHSEITFKIKHLMISTVSGYFEKFDGAITTEGDSFENAKFTAGIDVDSINTKNADRDGHLKSADFFDAEAFPKISFTSTAFDGETLTGDLTIRDVTKSVSLDVDLSEVVVDPYGQTKVGIEASTDINRQDFGLTWSAVTEAGKIMLGDKVKMHIDAQFVKQ